MASRGRRKAGTPMSIVPPRVGQLVEDRDLVAGGGQLARDGDAGRAGADDGDRRVARRDLRACRPGCRDAWCHSTRKRFMARMASGRSMSPRRQARSHGAEQT